LGIRNTCCLFAACALSAAVAPVLHAQSAVYRWVDENGVVHFGDAPPDAASGLKADTIVLPDVQTSFRSLPPPLANTTADATAAEPADETAPAPTPAASSARLPAPVVEQCSDPSPTIGTGQDLYDFSAEPDRLEPQEIALFRRLISTMQGRWRGPDTGFYCLERGAVDEKRPFDRTIEAEGDLNPPDQFVLDSRIQSRGSNRRELLRIEIRDRKLVINSGTATLISVSDGAIDFGYKVQVGGLVTEYYWRTTLAGARNMTLQQWTYTQGELSASSRWNLTKSR
jgi:hypothetical protein